MRTLREIDHDIAGAKRVLASCVEHHRPHGARSMRQWLKELRQERRDAARFHAAFGREREC